MIFVGTLDYGPGITAVNFFCNDILPLIHQKKPELNVAFVGQNPPPFLLKLAATDNRVIITGRVKDIRPFVLKSRVFIVPLKSGSGTRLKILDAMAMGIPIVSTNIGAEGLDVDNEKHLLLADTPHSFCDCIFKLLDDPNLSKSLVTGALTCLQEKYCWEIIWTKLTHVYDELKLSGTGY
jgi:glycosyltransferase involved in cell wall biosynthesis